MEFVGNVSLGDIQKAYAAAKQLDAKPQRLIGRLAGLGGSELDAGVPTWAWMTVAFGAGALAVYLFRDDVENKIRSLF